jgi:hypothetical protein
MASLYQPLADFLAAQPGTAVVLTLAEIEALLGAPLPPAAQEAAWWADAAEAEQARAWLGVGWRVRMMEWRKKRWAIIFERGAADATA